MSINNDTSSSSTTPSIPTSANAMQLDTLRAMQLKDDETLKTLKDMQDLLYSMNNSNNKATCFHCGRLGHYIADCRIRKQEMSGNTYNNNNNNRSQSPHIPRGRSQSPRNGPNNNNRTNSNSSRFRGQHPKK